MASHPPRILPRAIAENRFVQKLTGARPAKIAVADAERPLRRQPRINVMPVDVRAAGTVEAPVCQRRMKRKPTALPGLVTFRNLRLELPCTISDMSGSGAGLHFPPSAFRMVHDLRDLPSEMTLVLRSDRLEVPCEVRWRLNRSLGVRFLGAPRPSAKSRT